MNPMKTTSVSSLLHNRNSIFRNYLRTGRKHSRVLSLTALMAGLSTGLTALQAQDWNYQWSGGGASSTWNSTQSSRWIMADGYSGYPNGEGIFVLFSRPNSLGASQTVALNTKISLGRLDIGNIGTNASFHITEGTEGSFNFTSWQEGNAQLNQLAGIQNSGDTISAPITLSASLDINNPSAYDLRIAGGITAENAGLKTITVNSGGVIFSGAIADGAGTVGLVHNGGKVVLSGNNTYSGGTTIGAGSTLEIGAGGTTGGIVGDIENDGTLVFNRSDGFIYEDTISGSGDLIMRGGEKLVLEGHNSYSGDTRIESGTITISSDENLGNGGDIVFDNGSAWAQLEVTGVELQTSRNLVLNGNTARVGVAANRTFVVNGDISGQGGLTKRFAGTMVLNGTGTHQGETTVEGGTLIVNGDFSAANGGVNVNSGASLAGTGVLGGTTSVAGRLSPGNSIGKLTLGNLSLESTSTLSIELGRDGLIAISDQVEVNGSTVIAQGANLELVLLPELGTPAVGDIFWLLINNGNDAVSGTFDRLNGVVTSLGEGDSFTWGGMNWEITYQANAQMASFVGGNDIAIQAIPEPAILSLLFGSTATALVFAARRRRNASGRP